MHKAILRCDGCLATLKSRLLNEVVIAQDKAVESKKARLNEVATTQTKMAEAERARAI